MAAYLITGGAGFIGSHLAEALLKRGDAVVSLDNFDPFYDRSVKSGNLKEVERTAADCGASNSGALNSGASNAGASFTAVEGDLRDGAALDELFSRHRFDGVYHLAALAGVRPSLKNPVKFWDVNGTGTANLLERVREASIKKFVFASSSSVYGNCQTVPFSEDLFVGHPISPYAATKRAGELLCYNYSHLYDIHTICIRFFTVYGPRQRPDLAIHKFTRLIREGKLVPFFGDGTTERDYTYIADICDGLLAAMDYAGDCPYDIINLGESNTISLSGLVALLEKVLEQKAVLQRLPMQPGDVNRTWADVSRAREKLGYAPRFSKEEGIREFVKWFDGRRQTHPTSHGA